MDTQTPTSPTETAPAADGPSSADVQDLEQFIARYPRLFVLTAPDAVPNRAFLTTAMLPANGNAAHQ